MGSETSLVKLQKRHLLDELLASEYHRGGVQGLGFGVGAGRVYWSTSDMLHRGTFSTTAKKAAANRECLQEAECVALPLEKKC